MLRWAKRLLYFSALCVLAIVPAHLAQGPAPVQAATSTSAPLQPATPPATAAVVATFCAAGLLATLVAHRVAARR